MNWKEADEKIRWFASSHQLKLQEENFNYVEGQVTCYHLNEKDAVFYEIKHSKPLREYGSRCRLYSVVPATDLLIKASNTFFGAPKLSLKGNVNEAIASQLHVLHKRIKRFSWQISSGYLSWPKELQNNTVLIFESRDIKFAIDELDSIRNIHHALIHFLTKSTNQ